MTSTFKEIHPMVLVFKIQFLEDITMFSLGIITGFLVPHIGVANHESWIFAYFFRHDGFSHFSSIYVIKNNKEGQQSSCRFLLKPPSEPLLLDGSMSSSDGLPYDYDKKDDYMSPIHLWIEESCNSTFKYWHAFILLSHDHDHTSYFERRKVKEVPTYAYLIFDVSPFWFVTKHKGKFQGIVELMKWLHWIYDFT
jgi:hypothetical protein